MSVLVMSRSIMGGTDKGAGQLLNHGSQDLRIGAANAPLFYFLRAHPPIPHMLCAVPNTQIYDILDSRNRIGLRSVEKMIAMHYGQLYVLAEQNTFMVEIQLPLL